MMGDESPTGRSLEAYVVKLHANGRPCLKQKGWKHVRTNRRGWPPHAHGYAYPRERVGACARARAPFSLCSQHLLPPCLTRPFLTFFSFLSSPALGSHAQGPLSLCPQNSSGILSLFYDRSCSCFAVM